MRIATRDMDLGYVGAMSRCKAPPWGPVYAYSVCSVESSLCLEPAAAVAKAGEQEETATGARDDGTSSNMPTGDECS